MKDDPRGRKQALHADLRRKILTLRLKPGADLDEVTLAREYGLSRPPLREVLRQMAGEGYATRRTNCGAQVSPMTYGMLRTFFLVAPMICAAVARLAAMNARPDQIAELRDVQGRFRMALAGGDEDGAATVAAAHWTLSRDQIESFVTPPGLDMPLGGERGAGKDSDR